MEMKSLCSVITGKVCDYFRKNWGMFCKSCIQKKWDEGRRKVELRHDILDKRVHVEQVITRIGIDWERKFFINMDGVRILPYDPNSPWDINTLRDIREAYYKVKRRDLIKK